MTTLLIALAALLVVGAAVGLPGRARAALRRDAAATTMAHDSLPRLTPAELKAWLAQHPGAVVIDVRTPAEFAGGHLAGAVNLDVQASDFGTRAASLARDAAYVVYCRSGARSERAGHQLLDLGFTPVVNGGGYEPLAREGFPTARGSQRR
ncbi:MAG TPA: rhodanese-like domain-containing protein [Gemmatimonadaceae bacterium]|nr:rhodanese-like domain-containing protein [Gemmatimonadaceae bacterium]